ncbi:MAG: hypothetical protein IKG30_13030 [Clostridiales bacterium]|nr:hypothetical protein [Clostridiales bacterium]
MGNKLIITIYLNDGTSISYRKTYNYFEKGIIIENIEKAKDDEVVTFRSDSGDEILVTKKNITLVRISKDDPYDDTKEVS